MTLSPTSRASVDGPAPRQAAAILRTMVSMSRMRGRLGGFEIIKATTSRIVARARFDGEPCFLKAFLQSDGPQRAQAVETELAIAARALGSGPFRVVRCLFAARRVGFVVLSPVPGQPLGTFLLGENRALAAETFAMAGRWLDAYCRPRRERRRFEPARFLRTREAHFDRPFIRRLREADGVAAMLSAHIERGAGLLEGCDIDIAASHGDFIGRNLHRDGDHIHGFDIDGFRPVAVAQDVAQFLVDFQTSAPLARDTVCGIDAHAWGAMRDSGVLPLAEWTTTMPLHVAAQIERRHPTATLNPRAQARLEHMARSLLDDPAGRISGA